MNQRENDFRYKQCTGSSESAGAANLRNYAGSTQTGMFSGYDKVLASRNTVCELRWPRLQRAAGVPEYRGTMLQVSGSGSSAR